MGADVNKPCRIFLWLKPHGNIAADLIQEVPNAVARRQSVRQLATEVHTHPTLSEVVEVAYKQAAAALPAAA